MKEQACIDMEWFTEAEQLFLIVTSLGMMKYCVEQDMIEELLDEGSGIDEEFVQNLFNKIKLVIEAGTALKKQDEESLDLRTCEIEGNA